MFDLIEEAFDAVTPDSECPGPSAQPSAVARAAAASKFRHLAARRARVLVLSFASIPPLLAVCGGREARRGAVRLR
jgi:hypothetical protein